jgi:hypothetical protein
VRAAFLDRGPQRRAASEQVLLADELAERRGSHARREWEVAGLGAGPAAGRVL